MLLLFKTFQFVLEHFDYIIHTDCVYIFCYLKSERGIAIFLILYNDVKLIKIIKIINCKWYIQGNISIKGYLSKPTSVEIDQRFRLFLIYEFFYLVFQRHRMKLCHLFNRYVTKEWQTSAVQSHYRPFSWYGVNWLAEYHSVHPRYWSVKGLVLIVKSYLLSFISCTHANIWIISCDSYILLTIFLI